LNDKTQETRDERPETRDQMQMQMQMQMRLFGVIAVVLLLTLMLEYGQTSKTASTKAEISSASNSSTSFYVSSLYGNDSFDGTSPEFPFLTLNRSIQAALSYNNDEEEETPVTITIFVLPGVYKGEDNANLTITQQIYNNNSSSVVSIDFVAVDNSYASTMLFAPLGVLLRFEQPQQQQAAATMPTYSMSGFTICTDVFCFDGKDGDNDRARRSSSFSRSWTSERQNKRDRTGDGPNRRYHQRRYSREEGEGDSIDQTSYIPRHKPSATPTPSLERRRGSDSDSSRSLDDDDEAFGAIVAVRVSLSLINMTFDGSIRAVEIRNGTNTLLSDCSFQAVQVLVYGSRNTTIRDSSFRYYRSSRNTVLQLHYSNETRVERCLFEENVSTMHNGGAVDLFDEPREGEQTYTSFIDCLFKSNTAEVGNGGALLIRSGKLIGDEEQGPSLDWWYDPRRDDPFGGDAIFEKEMTGYDDKLKEKRITNENQERLKNAQRRKSSNNSRMMKRSNKIVVTIINCTFDENSSAQHAAGGGAIYVDIHCDLICHDSYFQYNTALYSYQGGGGAVLVSGSALFTNTRFTGNAADYSLNGGGGALYIEFGAKVHIGEGCHFVRNSAVYFYGGAVFDMSLNGLSFSPGVIFEDNQAYVGGAIMVWFSDGFVMDQLTFLRNKVYTTSNIQSLLIHTDDVPYSSSFVFETLRSIILAELSIFLKPKSFTSRTAHS